MSWIDDIFNSPILVYLLLALGAFHIYLKKTGQTLPEIITRIKEAFHKDD